MPAWLAFWKLAKPLMPYIVGILAVAALLAAVDHLGYQRGFHKRDAEVAALTGTITNLKAASVAAKAQNVAHVATVETKQDAVTKGHENDYPTQLADARAALAAYKRLHPAAAQGNAGRDQLPQVSEPAGQPNADASQAVVSGADLDACAKSYVTAVGLQSWIRDQAAIAR